MSVVSYGVLLTSMNLLQASPEQNQSDTKETAINFLNDHKLVTKSYLKSCYDNQGLEIGKQKGDSLNTWSISYNNDKLILNSSNQRATSSFIIDNYELQENNVLHFRSTDHNQHFWFHKDYILSEYRDDELEDKETVPTHKFEWYYFS